MIHADELMGCVSEHEEKMSAQTYKKFYNVQQLSVVVDQWLHAAISEL